MVYSYLFFLLFPWQCYHLSRSVIWIIFVEIWSSHTKCQTLYMVYFVPIWHDGFVLFCYTTISISKLISYDISFSNRKISTVFFLTRGISPSLVFSSQVFLNFVSKYELLSEHYRIPAIYRTDFVIIITF